MTPCHALSRRMAFGRYVKLKGDEWYEENQVGDDDEANGGAGGIGDTNWF